MSNISMIAPTPGHKFVGLPSGNDYTADSDALVFPTDMVDQKWLQNAGCILYSFTTAQGVTMTYGGNPQTTTYAPLTITSNTFTLTAANDEVLVNKTTPSATAIAITAMNVDHQYQFKDQAQNAATYNITLMTILGDGKIDGQTSQVINVNGESLTLVFNGTTTNIV